MNNKVYTIILLLTSILIVGYTSPKTSKKTNGEIPYWLADYKEVYIENPAEASRQWFKEAKFGMFIHLNLASLCENGKADYLLWKEGKAPDRLLDFVGISKDAYENSVNKDSLLATKYKLENFDAEAICKLAVAAKMKYINLTTQHLGRLYNFDTKTSEHKSVNTPCGKDLVKELSEACKKYNLALFLYLPPEFAMTTPERRELNLTIIKELLTNYGPIAGLWFDGIGLYYKNPENYSRLDETFSFIKELQPHCLVSFKEGAKCDEDFLTPEHFMLPFKYDFQNEGIQERWKIRKDRWAKHNAAKWESCSKYKLREVNSVMQICKGRDNLHVPSGWINDESARHLTADEVYYWLTYARFTGSNLLMNTGIRPDGSIHPDDVKAFIGVGRIIQKKGWPKVVHQIPVK
ncbi:MAG: alpha-L-fucosidase, partial [Prolixibacteraceae bacterium]|nr:alpha-L-fucosidase [Prolixibacteraceae bacterium]